MSVSTRRVSASIVKARADHVHVYAAYRDRRGLLKSAVIRQQAERTRSYVLFCNIMYRVVCHIGKTNFRIIFYRADDMLVHPKIHDAPWCQDYRERCSCVETNVTCGTAARHILGFGTAVKGYLESSLTKFEVT